MDYYTKAADAGYPNSQYNLGMMYLIGQGVDASTDQAVQLLQKAADGNFAAAQLQLGSMYESGQGVTQNLVEAYRWLSQAAANGNAQAAQARDSLAQRLTPDQISQAQKLASGSTP